MRWLGLLLLVGCFCSVLSTEEKPEPSLKIKARLSVYNVGEKRAIYCEGENLDEAIEWYLPSGRKVEGKSTKSSRVYVEKHKSEQKLLVLIIASAKVEDNGMWTCKSGELNETLVITVGEKVNMTRRFESLEEDEYKSIKLTCVAKGIPTPVVQWYFENALIAEDTTKYVMSQKDDTYTLNIKSLSHEDAGEYSCKAAQKALSHYIEKKIMLAVHHKPLLFNHVTKEMFTEKVRTEEVFAVMNATKNITCAAIANPAPTFRWFRRKDKFDDPILSEDLIIKAEDGMSSTFMLRMTDEEDKGQYKCTATNTKGQVSIIFDVTPGQKPKIPDSITFIAANASYITFNVTCENCTMAPDTPEPRDPENLPVIGYDFQLSLHKENYLADWEAAEEFPVEITSPEDTEFTVGPLTNTSNYDVRVRARNEAGCSDWLESKIIASTTKHAVKLATTVYLLIIALVFIVCY